MNLTDFAPLPEGDLQFPPEYIEARGLIKLRETGDQVWVGTSQGADVNLEAELSFFFRKTVRFVEISAPELSEFLSRRFSEGAPDSGPLQDEQLRLDRLAQDAPIVNLVNSVLMEGIRKNCSDIHLEALPQGARVRYRIDGILQTSRTLSRDLFPGISSRLKIMANLNIIEKRLPQDGRLSVQLAGQDVEFRMSVVPLAEGESIVLRLFHRRSALVGLDELGFSQDYVATLRRVGTTPHGMMLLTGPTGSGKTTTLNALIRELAHDGVKVVTIEDPVENVLDGVNQIQTNEAVGLTFDTILSRVLRQDPDILMVGEIRDKQTAELCLRSALTGHLVLATLHTNDALTAIPRMLDMGIESYLLAAVLRACSAQRLVRTICPHCREVFAASSAQQARVRALGRNLERLTRGRGCPECQGTGYRGRLAIGEIFVMNEVIEEMIVQRKRRQDLVEHYRAAGSRFLIEAGLDKVEQGIITLEELERVVVA